MSAADALGRLLGALGVTGEELPAELDERAALLRTRLADRRMLLLLDNVSTVEQVRPLLPGTPSSTALVTSRDTLPGLVAVDGARRVALELLPAADAHALLRRLIGVRVEEEPAAAAALAEQCARLPLALRVAAELAAARPGAPLSDLVAELADHRARLELLTAGGDPRASVPAVLSWSLRHLPPAAARLFGLLALHPGPDVDAHVAAALAGTDLAAARRTLELLARAHLVHPTRPGRHGMHDLLRACAEEHTPRGVPEAKRRLFEFYAAAAATAVDTLHPPKPGHGTRFEAPPTPVPVLAEPAAARRWLDAERAALVAVVAHTATHGHPRHAVRLSAVLYPYLVNAHPGEALTVHSHARDAARALDDHAGEARRSTASARPCCVSAGTWPWDWPRPCTSRTARDTTRRPAGRCMRRWACRRPPPIRFADERPHRPAASPAGRDTIMCSYGPAVS